MQLVKINSFIALLFLAFAGVNVASLESDREQDILYSSLGRSTSRIENGVRIITLEQDVKVTQGSLEITGDNAVFESEAESSTINRVTVTGSPAHYRQQLDAGGDFIAGESESIYYYVEAEPIVEFVGSAILRSTNDVISCAAIKYFTESRFTETTGPCEGVSGRSSFSNPPGN